MLVFILWLFCHPVWPCPAQAAGAPGKVVKIICLGDSLTSGQGLSMPEAYPAVLEKALNQDPGTPKVRVTNSGVAGETSAGLKDRLSWVLGEAFQVAVVVTGGNDLLRGLDPAGTERNLDAVLTSLRKRGLAVVLAGMRAPRNLGEKYQQAFDSLYPRLADRHRVLFLPFFLEPVAGKAELLQKDGLHPNQAGVRAIVGHILPLVKQAVMQAPSTSERAVVRP